MRQRIIDLLFIVSLIGTLYFGAYTMYQINTVNYYNIIKGVSK